MPHIKHADVVVVGGGISIFAVKINQKPLWENSLCLCWAWVWAQTLLDSVYWASMVGISSANGQLHTVKWLAKRCTAIIIRTILDTNDLHVDNQPMPVWWLFERLTFHTQAHILDLWSRIVFGIDSDQNERFFSPNLQVFFLTLF